MMRRLGFAQFAKAAVVSLLLLPTISVGQSHLPLCSNAVPVTGWDHCQGTQTFGNGNKYVGEFKDGKLSGQGTVTNADGKQYVGEFKNNKPDGQGTATSANGDSLVGIFKDGKLYGHGTETSDDGTIYVGEFKDSKHDGQGTLTYKSGTKYTGEFRDGKRNGQGSVKYADGTEYVGEYKEGKRNGQGTRTFPDGSKYVGEFKDGKRSGQGTYTYNFGERYVGEFRDDSFNGKGTITYTDRTNYTGEFKDGKRDGQGTYVYANGSKYVGEFRSGTFNGQGIYLAADGSIISSGIWADGKLLSAVRDQETISMEQSGGVYTVPIRLNDTITLDAVIDSGAADLSIPADIVSTLMRTKTVTPADFLGKQTYVLADGSKVPSQRFRIRSLKVGNKTVENVVASIASADAMILLGQSFLTKFKSWSVDNEQHALILR